MLVIVFQSRTRDESARVFGLGVWRMMLSASEHYRVNVNIFNNLREQCYSYAPVPRRIIRSWSLLNYFATVHSYKGMQYKSMI